jgi:hypothetical protein
MRKQLFLSVAMLGLLMTLAVASVHAQSQTKTTIPFDFAAGRANLKAGVYSVKFISDNLLLLRSADGKKSAIVVARRAIAGDTKNAERMVFHRYGDRYFLAQVWIGTNSGRELDPLKAERALAKELQVARANAKPLTVQVAAVPR